MLYGYSGIRFNGVHSSALHLIVTGDEREVAAEPRDSYIEIPEMDGSYLSGDNSKPDIMLKVDFVLSPPDGVNIYAAARAVGDWLTTAARAPLIFDDDPTVYYEAKRDSGLTANQIVSLQEFKVSFRAKPNVKEVGS